MNKDPTDTLLLSLDACKLASKVKYLLRPMATRNGSFVCCRKSCAGSHPGAHCKTIALKSVEYALLDEAMKNLFSPSFSYFSVANKGALEPAQNCTLPNRQGRQLRLALKCQCAKAICVSGVRSEDGEHVCSWTLWSADWKWIEKKKENKIALLVKRKCNFLVRALNAIHPFIYTIQSLYRQLYLKEEPFWSHLKMANTRHWQALLIFFHLQLFSIVCQFLYTD